jgi:hypothetical protein
MAIEIPQSCSFHKFITEDLFSSAPALRFFPASGANICSTLHSQRSCRIKIIKNLPIWVPNIIWNFSLFFSFLFRLHLSTIRHTHTLSLALSLGRTPFDQWSARSRDLYLTTHNTHIRQTCMPPGGIRTHSPSKREAWDPLFRPHSHRNQLIWKVSVLNRAPNHDNVTIWRYGFKRL